MPSPAAFSASFASALQPAASRQCLGSYLKSDTVVPGDEHRQYVLVIKNVDQRRLDASGEALRHLLTVHGGREAVGLAVGGATRWDRRRRESVVPTPVRQSVTCAVRVGGSTDGNLPRVSSPAA